MALSPLILRIFPISCRSFNSILSRNSTTKCATPPLSSVDENDPKPTTNVQNNQASIKPMFFNRNPRNLEKLTIARKPNGYHLDVQDMIFWHKLVLNVSRSGVTAQIIHNSGSKVLTVSTSEFGIRRYLHSTQDTSAYMALGKILAQRCLESGIHFVTCDIKATEGSKVEYLLKEAEKGGLSLKEPSVYVKPAPWGRGYPTKPWDVIT